ncbi:LemA family protein [Clostridium cochlearium]|uniref:LemA family protein n=1 Tax=Clostridium cochlearium TaxID=1494 RepID=UPI00157022D3|nr:LemA family protein [Clostridium cochlearium]MCG4572417.1 LemA family protein [Clostridium cochlearium]MCG4579044.1 LemA family protein [Clostridium cochlearium]NSJ91853.1 LemA family protein [Coprococcus sp. MSK.21.13]
MSKGLKNALIAIGVLIVLIFPIVSTYNKIVTLEQNVMRLSSNIDSDLKRRSDLIPNLVETTKGYAAHEKEVFTDIANARAKLGGANTIQDKANADSELSSALSRLLVVVERYPELKSNENFRALMVQLEGTENRINVSRKDYNDAVTVYNATIKRFPASIIASTFRFGSKEYYKADEASKEVPKVDFNTGK